MKVNFVNNCQSNQSFSGVFFVNKKSIAKTGENVIKTLLENDVVRQYTRNVDYDIFFKQQKDVLKWKIVSSYQDGASKNPWIPVLDSNSFSATTVNGYIDKFLPTTKKVYQPMPLNVAKTKSGDLVKNMELIENESKYLKEIESIKLEQNKIKTIMINSSCKTN